MLISGKLNAVRSDGTTNGVFGGPVSQESSLIKPVFDPQMLLNSAIGVARADALFPLSYSSEGSDPIFLTSTEDQGPLFAQGPGGVITYTVQKKDTLSQIAARFGISPETIVNANSGIRPNALREGQELKILPVSGILYTIKSSDTVEGILDKFHISLNQLISFNRGFNPNVAEEGALLLIPGAKPEGNLEAESDTLPFLPDYFKQPAEGFNWGKLHSHNAVDIANVCGTPVYAAAEGLIVPDDTYGDGADGWNGGYGHFITLAHPNGTKTRYAHLDKVLVKIGDYLSVGTQVGTMGNTGNVHGPTGCHLHFEVYGAQNPFITK